MISFKFVAVKNGDKKSSALTGSVRSHAIRAGLRKTARRPKVKTAEKSLGLKQSRDAHNFGSDGYESIESVPSENALGTVSTESRHRDPAQFEPDEKVDACQTYLCIS